MAHDASELINSLNKFIYFKNICPFCKSLLEINFNWPNKSGYESFIITSNECVLFFTFKYFHSKYKIQLYIDLFTSNLELNIIQSNNDNLLNIIEQFKSELKHTISTFEILCNECKQYSYASNYLYINFETNQLENVGICIEIYKFLYEDILYRIVFDYDEESIVLSKDGKMILLPIRFKQYILSKICFYKAISKEEVAGIINRFLLLQ